MFEDLPDFYLCVVFECREKYASKCTKYDKLFVCLQKSAKVCKKKKQDVSGHSYGKISKSMKRFEDRRYTKVGHCNYSQTVMICHKPSGTVMNCHELS